MRQLKTSSNGYVGFSDPNAYTTSNSSDSTGHTFVTKAAWNTKHVASCPRHTWRVKDAIGGNVSLPSSVSDLWSLVKTELIYAQQGADASYTGIFMALGNLEGTRYVAMGVERSGTGANSQFRLWSTGSATAANTGTTFSLGAKSSGEHRLTTSWIARWNTNAGRAGLNQFAAESWADEHYDTAGMDYAPSNDTYGFDVGAALYLHVGAYTTSASSTATTVKADAFTMPALKFTGRSGT